MVIPYQEYELVFRASKELPDGTRIFARDYGVRAFPIRVPRKPRD